MKFGRGSSAPSDYLFILAEYFYFNHHFPTLSTNIYNTDVTTLSDNSAFEIYCTNSPPHHHHIRLGVNDSDYPYTTLWAFLMKTSEKLNHCLPN